MLHPQTSPLRQAEPDMHQKCVCLVMWLMLLAAGSVVPAQAAPADDPLALITTIYKTYQSDTDTPGLANVYSRRLQGLIDEDEKKTPPGEAGTIDWDLFIDGNDWVLSNLRIALVSRSATRARVRAAFENHQEPRDIAFDLVHEDGRWVIDDIASTRMGGRWTMSKILMGAPDAFPDQKK